MWLQSIPNTHAWFVHSLGAVPTTTWLRHELKDFFFTCYWWIRTLMRLQLNGQQFGVKVRNYVCQDVSAPVPTASLPLLAASVLDGHCLGLQVFIESLLSCWEWTQSQCNWTLTKKFAAQLDFLFVDCTCFCVRNTYETKLILLFFSCSMWD